MRALLRILQPAASQRIWMLGGIALGVAVICANTLLMALSGWFIASMAVAGAAKVSFNFFFASATIRALAILRTVGRYAERLVTHEAAFRILADLRVWLFRRLIPLAPAGLEQYAGGDLSGRLRADLDSLETLYLRIIAPLLSGLVTILLAGLFVWLWSGSAAIVLLTMLLVAGLLVPLAGRRLAEQPGRESVRAAAALRSQVTQGLQGAEELLLLGSAERQAEQINQLSADLIRQQSGLSRITALTMGSITLLAGLCLALLCLVLIPEVQQVRITGPNLVMLLLFSAACFEAVAPLSHSLQLIPATNEAVARIEELASATPPLPEPLLPQQPESYAIELNQVCLQYPDGPSVLQQFSLRIAEGERVAVVGPSGSGKSSLVELLLRFRPYQGSVRIGGAELREIPAELLAGRIAAVPQQPHLFNSSIRDNILMGRDCSDECLQTILHDCCLEDWIAGLPHGLLTSVGEAGSAVSGGEARRIALARALVADAPILLLDEPTEGLDGATEQTMVKHLCRRLQGKTVLVVTHRPACLGLAERIIRIETEIGGEYLLQSQQRRSFEP